MTKGRLEAFSDGVIAIIITIMVLELKVPHGADWAALRPLIPKFASYVLSFAILGIYWNNHHHMLHATDRINGTIMWANLNLLFWMSLLPFSTAWWGETYFAPTPTALHGVVQLMCAIAYTVLQRTIVAHHGRESRLAAAIGRDFKGKLSLSSYVAAILVAFALPLLSGALYVFVICLWFLPDRRIETKLDR